MMAIRPSAVAFDVVETLMSLHPLAARFEKVGQPASLLPAWFARLLLYGMGLSAAGDYVPFGDAAGEALRAVAHYEVSEEDVQYVLAGFADLPAQPDAKPAMLRRSGLESYMERVVATAEVHSWKPPAQVYLHALEVLGLPAERVAMVAVHAWDCHGAKRAGLTTGWASRLEGRYGRLFAPVDVTGADLAEVAQGLLALPADG
jgi:2-haloacid dehalogenase